MTQMANIGLNTGIATARTAPVADPAKAEQRAALEKAAKGFEAVLMRQLLGSMRSAGIGEGIDSSSAVDQFREMSDAQMAENLASKNSLGIAQLLLQQLDK